MNISKLTFKELNTLCNELGEKLYNAKMKQKSAIDNVFNIMILESQIILICDERTKRVNEQYL